ncbi:MAG: hypothetical protein CMI09_05180 [Oceanospirillaceae bacterium]|nr:hypothetical protein [Oceanospirillaceae bacterium]|tara:strand:+ start:860 stop:2134 length:1275 start_codon:yes stop_codon:yes gene_type:complete
MFWRSNTNGEDLDYESAGPLLSPAELSFYQVASAAVGKSAMVLAKVRMVNVIKPRTGLADARWRKLFDPLAQKHLDFVLIDAETLEAMCVLEFESSTQLNEERVKRNEYVQSVCDSAGIPRVLIDARGGFDINEIREKLAFLWADDGDAIVAQVAKSEVPVPVAHTPADETSSESEKPSVSKEPASSDVESSEHVDTQTENAAPQPVQESSSRSEDDMWSLGGSQSSDTEDGVPLAISMDLNDPVVKYEQTEQSSAPDGEASVSEAVTKPVTKVTAEVVETAESTEAESIKVEKPQQTPSPKKVIPAVANKPVPETKVSAADIKVEPTVNTSVPVPGADVRKPVKPSVPAAAKAPVKSKGPATEKPKVKAPDCPKCGSPLSRRQPKSGKLAGQFIWVCSTYPECRYLAPLKAHKMIKVKPESVA